MSCHDLSSSRIRSHARVTLKGLNQLIPPARRSEVVLGRGVVRNGSVCAAFRRLADAAAWVEVRVAVLLLAVWGKSGRVEHVGCREVGADAKGDDFMCAIPGGFGTSAQKDLFAERGRLVLVKNFICVGESR